MLATLLLLARVGPDPWTAPTASASRSLSTSTSTASTASTSTGTNIYAQAQLVEWTTNDGSPPPQPLKGYCGTHKEDQETKKLRHAPLACAGTFKHWYADGSDPSLRACAERCLACRESGGACRYVSFSFDRTGKIPHPYHPNPNPHPPNPNLHPPNPNPHPP